MQTHRKIFLADDDIDDRELFIEALSQPDISVMDFPNGKALLTYLTTAEEQSLPDMIFLDLNMPVMGGKECLRHIRSFKKFDDLPIIIYSTSSNNKEIEETFALGANLYVTKSSSYMSLKKTLEDIIRLDWAAHPPHHGLANFVYKLT